MLKEFLWGKVAQGSVRTTNHEYTEPNPKWLDMVYAPKWEKMGLCHRYRTLDFLWENIA